MGKSINRRKFPTWNAYSYEKGLFFFVRVMTSNWLERNKNSDPCGKYSIKKSILKENVK